MAETSMLKSSAIVRNGSSGTTAAKPQAQVSGGLPVVQVNMNAGGPQIQGGNQARQGVTILPPRNVAAKNRVEILPPTEQRAAAVAAAAMTPDQWMLCRHLIDKYLGELRASVVEAKPDETIDSNIKLAEAAIVTIDAALTAATAAAAAAVAAAAAAAAAPAPLTAAGRVFAAAPHGRRPAGAMPPRRIVRSSPLPVVGVKMNGDLPVVEEPVDSAQSESQG